MRKLNQGAARVLHRLGILFLVAALCLSFASCPVPQLDSDDYSSHPTGNVSLHYQFDGNAVEANGSGKNGILEGPQPAPDRFNRPAGALSFDGVDDKITFHEAIIPTGPKTVSLWIESLSKDVDQEILTNALGGTLLNSGFDLFDYADNSLRAAIGNGSESSDFLFVQYANGLNDGNWHYIAVVFDGNSLALFIDSALVRRSTFQTGTESLPSSGLSIGRSNWAAYPWWFKGSLDDLQIESRALSQSEIEINYHQDGWAIGAAPTVPTGLFVDSVSASTVALSWNPSANAASYQVYRDISADGAFLLKIFDGNALTVTDSGLNSATTYFYKVRASNQYGQSEPGSAVSATTLIAPPPAPSLITLTNITARSVTVSWDPVGTASGYKLYRATDYPYQNGWLNSLLFSSFSRLIYDGPDPGFVDSGLLAGVRYYYEVVAYNSQGDGQGSTIVSGTTLNGEIQLSFQIDGSRRDYYESHVAAGCSYAFNPPITTIFAESYSQSAGWSRNFYIFFSGDSAGTYADGFSSFTYYYSSDNYFRSSSSSVNVSHYGEVGDYLIGSFSGTLSNGASVSGGSFNILR